MPDIYEIIRVTRIAYVMWAYAKDKFAANMGDWT